MEVKIIGMDHNGNGIGRIDEKIVFVPKTITADVCDIEIKKHYKKYDVAKLNKILDKSPDRIESVCPYYNICGGCNISNLTYAKQVEFKTDKVKNIFKKYLNLDINPKVIDSIKEYGYRNKITYHKDISLGLVGEFEGITAIDDCMLVSDRVNKLYHLIKNKDLSNLKLVTIRECDNGLILIITGKIDVTDLYDECTSIYMNNECIYKKEDGYISIGNIKYKVSPNSFFQINTSNISRLYDEIINYGNFNKNDKVIDLYSGVGSISLYIAKCVKEVLGIEIIPDAINDARHNAETNNIQNVKFLCGDVARLVDDNILGDVLIVDPPRVGLDKHTVEVINNKNIRKVIYVSCNPMTLVRDLKLLDNYSLQDISVVDMFPQTHHIECVCLLTFKN